MDEVKKELIKRLEELINRLDKAEVWIGTKGITDWEHIRGSNAYVKRKNIIKELEYINTELEKYL